MHFIQYVVHPIVLIIVLAFALWFLRRLYREKRSLEIERDRFIKFNDESKDNSVPKTETKTKEFNPKVLSDYLPIEVRVPGFEPFQPDPCPEIDMAYKIPPLSALQAAIDSADKSGGKMISAKEWFKVRPKDNDYEREVLMWIHEIQTDAFRYGMGSASNHVTMDSQHSDGTISVECAEKVNAVIKKATLNILDPTF